MAKKQKPVATLESEKRSAPAEEAMPVVESMPVVELISQTQDMVEAASIHHDVTPSTTKPKMASYRVKETTTVSLFGQIVRLPQDSVVSEASYGAEGVKRIMDSNVPLELLD